MKGTVQSKTTKKGVEYLYIYLNYKDPITGKRKQKVIATGLTAKGNKRKAEAMVNDMVEKYKYLEAPRTVSTVDNHISLCDFLDHWLAGKKMELRQSTYEGYACRIHSIKSYFEKENPELISLRPRDFNEYFKYALEYGKINQKNHKRETLSVRTVRNYRNILHVAYNEAIIDGIIDKNPLDTVVIHGKKNREYSEEFAFLTEEEISDCLHFIKEYYPRLTGIAFMGAYYGLRRSEILGLEWSAIDWNKGTIAIQHTVVRVTTITAEDATKTLAGARVLNLFDTARSCLLQIKQQQECNKAFYGKEYANHKGYVFTWEDGRPYDPNYISHLFTKAMKEYGRPEITLHKLRHTCCSLLINKGWDLKKLQYWLGHSDASTTLNIYSHFNRKRLNESQNDLNSISAAVSDIF
ncbi:MAG TPA: hypothetical protein DF613_01900 [Lachnospiraceae bacterium]|nr:hypothetical protein [Lachnospiraceae bacterium]